MTVSVSEYKKALAEELLPAMGCTEPIALAYASAEVAKRLGGYPESVDVEVSRNIVKNVKSVIVPNTGGLSGIEAAVAAGLVAARPESGLQVLADVTNEEREEIQKRYTLPMNVHQSDEPDVFFIRVTGTLNNKTVAVTIRTFHTNITEIRENGEVVFSKENAVEEESDSALWSIADIIRAARTMDLTEVEPLLQRQMDSNLAIAKEGLNGDWGATIGKIMLLRDPDDPGVRARAWAAAASDARMNGCELPVIIVSGSGNQGITASIPVVVFGETLKAEKEAVLRALLLSDLVTIALKQGIGKLSAYCGAVSAGCGSGAGIAMLEGFSDEDIQTVIRNALAITSGLLCDGAKSSCAAKISMSIEGALLALDMVKNHKAFKSGDGIVQDTTDDTAAAVGEIASRGMVDTDREIIRIMLHQK